jgi:hypothetical protein
MIQKSTADMKRKTSYILRMGGHRVGAALTAGFFGRPSHFDQLRNN